MRIRDGLHLVASGRAGFDLTHPLDCNVYMLDTGTGFILFDSGAGSNAETLLAEVERDGVDPRRITAIYLTHAHADHSGGAEPLRERLPHLTVLAGPRTAAILAQKNERLISLDKARGSFYPADYLWTAPAVDTVLTPGAPHVVGDLRLTFLETPGHSDDHGSFLVARQGSITLVSGDAVFAGGKVVLQDIPDCSVSATIATIRKLAALEFETFLPGHGLFSLAGGKRHVEAALRYTDMGLPPPSFF